MADSGALLTYSELDAIANQLSHWFRSIGLQTGDHVAFCMENRLEYLPIVWGCHYAGLYYTAVSSRLHHDEASYIVNNCGAKAFLASPYVADIASQLGKSTPGVRARLSVGGPLADHEPFEVAIANMPTTPLDGRVEGNDMLYSSGTTGRPKGIKTPMTGDPLGTGDGVTALGQTFFGFEEGCVYLSPGPLYHAAPLRFCRAVLRVGGTVVVMARFEPEQALAAIERFAVTTSQWVPTMFIRMLKLPGEVRERYDLSSLTCAVHAGAPMPMLAKEQMIDWWGPIIHEYYAGTEGNGLTYCDSKQWLEHKGSVGAAVLGVLHILDDDGNELPVGSEGGVYFSGGSEFEYHDDPEKTADSYTLGGRSTLGDVGRVDEDGFLYLTDRKAFMIISGGVNIYPQEAENVLSMHADVIDAAVFGVPHDDLGEEVKAVVQPREMPADDAAAAALELLLLAVCRQQLADVKCPRSIDFREELPRHPTGKLYKRLLKDEYVRAAGKDSFGRNV
ncbi:MAG: long-chain acyl-CoA synthetase [Verrucomicrobiales bacterium]|jgi:long-chain acyl-CoA synthetase